MGTRSTIRFYEMYSDGINEICCIYQQFDGYPRGVGKWLCEWLWDKYIINGISSNEERYSGKFANGAGCLAAQFIRDFKKEAGYFYIYPTDVKDINFDYNYKVFVNEEFVKQATSTQKCVSVAVNSYGRPIFGGNLKRFKKFIDNREEDEEYEVEDKDE